MKIGDRLKYLRTKDECSTQMEFSKKIGISNSYLSDLENNRKSPSLKTVSKIAERLGITTDELLYGSTAEQMLLKTNLLNENTILDGKLEFTHYTGNETIERMTKEMEEAFQKKSEVDKNFSNYKKWAQKWMDEFFVTFYMAPPPVRILLARYYSIEKSKRYPIDTLLYTMSDYIEDSQDLIELFKGRLTMHEQ